MINPELIRENYDQVKQSMDARKAPLEALELYRDLDAKWRKELVVLESLKQEMNAKTPKGKPTEDERQLLSELSTKIKQFSQSLTELEEEVKEAALQLPNVLSQDVPIGESEADNPVEKIVGTPNTFEFTPKSHDELGGTLDLVDFERSTKIAGARTAIYKGLGARLERSLINFMLDIHTKNHGYTEVFPPVLVNAQSLKGTGQLPKFASDLFVCEDSPFWLSPTSEVQLTNMYAGEVLEETQLPILMTAFTPCFRKEAGSYGKDMKGLIRLHQFQKVELVKLVKPEESAKEHQALLQNAATILDLLKLPYRIVKLCSADTGFSSALTYDIEVWLPSQNCYREISSCSNFLDFQARRAMIRYKGKDAKKPQYLHTLNGSGLAVGRTWAAIVENYQNADGSIRIPDVLIEYMGVSKINGQSK